MLVYFSFIITIVTAIILVLFFKKKVQWWEIGVSFIATVIMVLIAKWICVSSLTSDTEWLGGYVTEVRYYEEWDEEVPCRHEIPCSHPEYCKDSNGKEYQCGYKHSNDGYRHAYDVDDHPEHWVAYTTLSDYSIGKKQYDQLVEKFGTGKSFVDLHRDYHSIDGDMYSTLWNGTDETLEPVSMSETYENRPKASHSIYHYDELDSVEISTYKPFEYPEISNNFHQKVILGFDDKIASQKLQVINSRLGRSKQVRVFLLVFKNLPRDAGYVQEKYWEGGNKNEIVVCVGIDNANNVTWGHVFSWTETTGVMVNVQHVIENQKQLNLSGIIDTIGNEINGEWQRKPFHDFDYLSIEPTINQIILIYVLTLLLNIGIGIWIVLNEFEVND